MKHTSRQFLTTLLMTLMRFRGKATFRNLSRYRDYDENTYARGCRRPFDLLEFNHLAIAPLIPNQETLVAALDCRFIPKSGKHPEGLGKFYLTHLTQSTSEPPITPITPITQSFLGVNSSWTTDGVNRDAEVGLLCVICVICGSNV